MKWRITQNWIPVTIKNRLLIPNVVRTYTGCLNNDHKVFQSALMQDHSCRQGCGVVSNGNIEERKKVTILSPHYTVIVTYDNAEATSVRFAVKVSSDNLP